MMPERMQLWTEWRSLKDKRLKAIKAQKLKVRELELQHKVQVQVPELELELQAKVKFESPPSNPLSEVQSSKVAWELRT